MLVIIKWGSSEVTYVFVQLDVVWRGSRMHCRWASKTQLDTWVQLCTPTTAQSFMTLGYAVKQWVCVLLNPFICPCFSHHLENLLCWLLMRRDEFTVLLLIYSGHLAQLGFILMSRADGDLTWLTVSVGYKLIPCFRYICMFFSQSNQW